MLTRGSSGRQDIYRCILEADLVVESAPVEYLIQGIFQMRVWLYGCSMRANQRLCAVCEDRVKSSRGHLTLVN